MQHTHEYIQVRPAVGYRKQDLDMSMQDLASRAASRVMATTVKNISAPKSAYEFEVSWRALSDDSIKQASLLKVCHMRRIYTLTFGYPSSES